MILRRAFVLSLLCSAALPIAAASQTVFMVQLGTFESEQQAAEHWKKLSSAFPDVFETLQYTPGEVVMRPDNFVTYRTQAGPIPTRSEAESICDVITSNGYECYVAETAMFYTDDSGMAAGLEQQIGFDESEQFAVDAVPVAPAQQQAQPAPKEPPVAEVRNVPVQATMSQRQFTQADYAQTGVSLPSGYIPSTSSGYGKNTSSATTYQQQEPVVAASSAPQGKGTIAVEEAIPVPLSDGMGIQDNPYIERGNRLMDAHPSDSSRISSFWAEISFFNNEQTAAQYVRALKARDPMLPAKLRIRITRPFGNVRGEQRLSLRMGPFMTTRPVRRLCSLTTREKLRCRAVKDLGGSVRHDNRYATRSASNRGLSMARHNAYDQRRRDAATAIAPRTANTGYSIMSGAYYVQLGSFLSPEAAEDKWLELQSSHSNLLRTAKKDIMAPSRGSNASRLFRLRTGPFADHSAASALCSQLKTQGTLCIVVK